MAKMTLANAHPLAHAEVVTTAGTKVRYTVRSDGKLLRQFRFDGRLEGAAISATFKAREAVELVAAFRRYVARFDSSAIVEVLS